MRTCFFRDESNYRYFSYSTCMGGLVVIFVIGTIHKHYRKWMAALCCGPSLGSPTPGFRMAVHIHPSPDPSTGRTLGIALLGIVTTTLRGYWRIRHIEKEVAFFSTFYRGTGNQDKKQSCLLLTLPHKLNILTKRLPCVRKCSGARQFKKNITVPATKELPGSLNGWEQMFLSHYQSRWSHEDVN